MEKCARCQIPFEELDEIQQAFYFYLPIPDEQGNYHQTRFCSRECIQAATDEHFPESKEAS